MDVYIVYWDQDRHGAGCECGLCNSNGKSYGMALFDARTGGDDPLDVCYAPSEDAATHNAHLEAQQQGWRVLPQPEEE